MSKGLSIASWILVGALAAGIGTGYFLFQANADRTALHAQTAEAERAAQKAKAESDRLAKEANAKLSAAAAEVASAQATVGRLRLERELMAKATSIPIPAPSVLKSWTTAISIPLGISFRFPSPFFATSTGREMTLNTQAMSWLSLQPYNTYKESAWLSQLKKPEPVTYAAGGQLFTGQKGLMTDAGTVYVLHTLSNGSSSLLVWAKPENIVNEKRLFEILSTISTRP
ncbi:MAG: hypothetical protein Q7R83_01505 [bacterium]|nr:hypothetical protein [bacterium]